MRRHPARAAEPRTPGGQERDLRRRLPNDLATDDHLAAGKPEPTPRRPAARVSRLLQSALDDLPARYAERIANVEFVVARTLSRRDRHRLGVRGELYGLYEGIPLTRRDSGYDRVTPDRITIYWGPLVRDFADDGALAAQVRATVYHEIGHYFGLDEADLKHSSVE